MSIEVIKEGNILRVVESSEPIVDGTKLTLYTASELDALAKHPSAWVIPPRNHDSRSSY